MIELVIRMPSDWTVPEDPQTDREVDIVETLRGMRAIWTGDPQPQTRRYDVDDDGNDEKLAVGIVQSDLSTVEEEIDRLSLPWTVLGAKDSTGMIRTPAEADVKPFMPDEPVLDSDGNITGWGRPETVRLGRYSGWPEWKFS